MNIRFLTAVAAYFAKLAGMFAKTSGPASYALYMDNNDGRFSFQADALVAYLNICMSDADINQCKAAIEATGIASALIDTRSLTWHYWNTMTWTTSVVEFGTIIKPGRMYFSSYNRRVYMSDAYCAVRRLVKHT